MKLTINQVKHAAKLANLPVSDTELEIYSEQLSEILDYVDQLNSVNTQDVEPTYNIARSANTMREDLTGQSLTQEESLQNASLAKKGYFVTQGVFNEGS